MEKLIGRQFFQGFNSRTILVLELGIVVSSIDGIARVLGMDVSFVGEVIFIAVTKAMSMNLERLMTGISILGNDRRVEQGEAVERSFTELIIAVGFFLIGRIIDPAANYLDEYTPKK